MSEQNGVQSSTKQRRSSQASKQTAIQVPALQRPSNGDKVAWKTYWMYQGQPWRKEPEIDAERQKYLAERRAITPNIEQGIYPFKDIKLSRADVEWLLATHENGRGPVDWNDQSQRNREGLDLRGAILNEANLSELPLARICGGLKGEWWNAVPDEQLEMAAVHLEGADLRAHLEDADLSGAHLEGADLRAAYLEQANLCRSHLESARLHFAQLESAFIRAAHLEGAILYTTNLKKAVLVGVHLENTYLNEAFLGGSHLREVILSDHRHVGPRVADTHWENTNLAVVQWSLIKMLGDEYDARQKKRDGNVKSMKTHLKDYEQAVRANRQLAIALLNQGLNEDASRFAYRAQLCQRIVLRMQNKFGQYLFSGFLDLLAGYGYRPGRSVLWYLVMIFGFALAYHFLGGLSLFPPDAVIFSIMSFHGRGFFPSLSSETNLHNPLVMLAAAEAIVGLLIEISFIATFTQRFFGK